MTKKIPVIVGIIATVFLAILALRNNIKGFIRRVVSKIKNMMRLMTNKVVSIFCTSSIRRVEKE